MRKSKGNKSANGSGEQETDPKNEEETSGEEFEVDKIINKRKKRGKTEYLVRWKGFSENDDTWEAEDNLTCPQVIAAFLESEQADDEPLVKAGKGKKRGRGSGKSSVAKKKKTENEESTDDEVSEKEYEVEKVLEVHHKKNGEREFLVRWKGYSKKDDTWEPEKHLNCDALISAFMKKVTQAKEVSAKDMRVNRKATKRFVLQSPDSGRKLSARNRGARRTYYDQD